MKKKDDNAPTDVVEDAQRDKAQMILLCKEKLNLIKIQE